MLRGAQTKYWQGLNPDDKAGVHLERALPSSLQVRPQPQPEPEDPATPGPLHRGSGG